MADLMEIARAAAKAYRQSQTGDREYTLADLGEMDSLLREIARLERWPEGILEKRLDQRRRMAPVNVIPALHRLREAHEAVLAGKPRPKIVLCQLRLIEGGKR